MADICDKHGIAVRYHNYFTLTVLFNRFAVLFTDCLALSHTTSILPSESLIQTYSHFLKPDFLVLTCIKVTKILQVSRNLNFLQFISVAIIAGYCRFHYAWIPHNWALQNFMNLLLLWLGTVCCINMWLICRVTEQCSPIKTVGYFVYSHIQEDTVKMSNSTDNKVIMRKILHQQFPEVFNMLST